MSSKEGVAKARFGAKSALSGQEPDSAQIACSKPSKSICAETGPVQKSSNLASTAAFATPSIGIFDSGFGGLTVMKAIAKALPFEDITYFGDTARIPYGSKSRETITRYSLENARFLEERGIKVLVIACHTASCVALEAVARASPLPVIGVSLPVVDLLVKRVPSKKIVVLGTRATINSQFYQGLLREALPNIEVVGVACPLFVPIVEEGLVEHEIAKMAIKEYLKGLNREEIGSVVLACTHYPLLAKALQEELGEEIPLIDPSEVCASFLKEELEKRGLLKGEKRGVLKGEKRGFLKGEKSAPLYRFFVSDDAEKFKEMGEPFWGREIGEVVRV